MSIPTLFVPIKVDGLFLPTARQGVGPLADFTRLPFVDGTTGDQTWDANSENPWITETIAPEPVVGGERGLEAGVHLHWAMPDALTKGTHPRGSDGQLDTSSMVFPTLPNRWLVVRRSMGVVQKRWVIESDYLWPADYPWGKIDAAPFIKALGAKGAAIWAHLLDSGWLVGTEASPSAVIAEVDARITNDLCGFAPRRAEILRALHEIGHAPRWLQRQLTSVKVSNLDDEGFAIPGQPPFRHMGRFREVGEGWPQTGTAEYLAKYKQRLTAIGHGDPTFAAFYPNCRSVFGFHDALHTDKGNYEYDVMGWFSDASNDPLGATIDAKLDGWLRDAHQWELTGADKSVQPGGSVFIGRVHCNSFVPNAKSHVNADAPGQALRQVRDVEIAVGNTGTEAHSAFLAAKMAAARHGARISERTREKTKIEAYLQALHLSDNLEHRQLDVGAKFAESRHKAGFVAEPGGHIWTVRALAATPQAADATDRVEPLAEHLPPGFATALSELNARQRAYERATRKIAALRWQIYSDWSRYMRYAYPHSEQALDMDASRDHHDIDVAVAYLRQGSIALFSAEVARTGVLILTPEPRSEGGEAQRQGHRRVRLAPGSDPASLAGQICDSVKAFRAGLKAWRAKLPDAERARTPIWQLETAPAPRFYRPNDPVVLLSGGALEPTDRHGQDGALHDEGLLRCHVRELADPLSGKLAADDVDKGAATLIATGGALFDALAASGAPQAGIRRGRRMAGHPFLLEWEVTLSPVRSSSDAETMPSQFSPDFIARNWHLGETDCTLTAESDLAGRVEASSVVRGRGFLSDHSDGLLRSRLERYLKRRMDGFERVTGTKIDDPLAYLAEHYQAVRSFFVSGARDIQAKMDGAALMALHSADPQGCVQGIAEGGSVAKAVLALVNQGKPADLVTLAGLDPALVRLIVLRRAGANFLASTFLNDEESVAAALTALKIDAAIRLALLGKPARLADYLCGTLLTDGLIAELGLDPALAGRLPKPQDGLAVVSAHLGQAQSAKADPVTSEALAGAPLTNIFGDLANVATLAPLLPDGGASCARLFALLLRFAHFNGFFGRPKDDTALVEESPSLHGLPTDGPIEAAILKMVSDHLGHDDKTLLTQVRLPDFAVADLRNAEAPESLSALMDHDRINLQTLAKLFHAVDRDHNCLPFDPTAIVGPTVGVEGGAEFATRAPGGHAWSDPILTALDAWWQIKSGATTISQALTGFNDGLLMQRRGWQLPVGDPLGFLAYRTFSEKTVGPIVGTPVTAPTPNAGFHPIRSGQMNLTRLRLVDTFGQVSEINAQGVTTAEHMTGTGGAQVSLPPRITQSARLNFRWLDAESGNQEWSQHPESTPICGWVVLNNLEGRLMIYTSKGAPLGSIDQSGRWRTPPGNRGGVTAPDSIANPWLRQLVKWMLDEAARQDDQSEGFKKFMNLCETALENIDPEGAVLRQAQSLLMGRPMALVRAAIAVECRDPYAVDQSVEAFGKELQGHPRNTSGFEGVGFPVRIGEHMQLNDGVVAFWPEARNGFAPQTYKLASAAELIAVLPGRKLDALQKLGTTVFVDEMDFRDAVARSGLTPADQETVVRLSARAIPYAPQSDWVRTSAERTSRREQNALNLWMPLDSPGGEMHVSILMDPRGTLHATCGVLPTKQLSIPQQDYVAALNAINVSFLTAPLLTKRKSIEVGLPEEAGWVWSWLSKHDGRWSEVPQTPVIGKAAFTHAFGPKTGSEIWLRLLLSGWLVELPDNPEAAHLAPVPAPGAPGVLRNGRRADDLVPHADRAEDVLRVLELGTLSIGRATIQAHFAQQELSEGWLLLSPRPDRPVPAPLADEEQTS